MAARVSQTAARTPPRASVRPRRVGHSAGVRLLFTLALFTLAFASIYTSLGLTRRAWPALFPGKSCDVCSIVADLGVGPIKIPDTPTNSVFNQRKNLLIIGLDSRPGVGELDPARTDTLMIATIDPVSSQMSLLSIPRDMWITIHPLSGAPTYPRRINESYQRGILDKGTVDAGAAQLKHDLKLELGIDIDYWVTIDFTGVEKLIDALGGIDIVIPDDLAVYNWYYSDDDVHARNVTIPRGVQHLDGYNAVAFGRNRQDNDFNRIKRQQLVLQTAVRKVFSNGLLDNPLDLWDAYSKIVHTDLPRGQMPGYGLMLKDGNPNMRLFSLADPVDGKPTMIGYTTEDGASVQLWDKGNVQYWISQVFSKATYSASSVEIDNGTGADDGGRSKALARYLSYSKGLPAIQLGPDAVRQPDTTITLYTENRRPLAEDLATWLALPPAAIKVQKKPDAASPDILIVIGATFKPPTN